MARKPRKGAAEALSFDAPKLEPTPYQGGQSVWIPEFGVTGIYRNKIRNTPYHYVSANGKLHTLTEDQFSEATA